MNDETYQTITDLYALVNTYIGEKESMLVSRLMFGNPSEKEKQDIIAQLKQLANNLDDENLKLKIISLLNQI